MKAGLAYRSKTNGERGIVYANKLLEVVNIRNLPNWAPVWGDGTLDDPFRPTQAQQWAWLAEQQSGAEPMFIEIGERVIARWGTKAGKFKDYATDVTAWKGHVRDRIVGQDNRAQPLGIQTIADEAKRIDDEVLHLDPRQSVYTRKALRIREMSDVYAAHKSRQLLQGIGSANECPELASSLCALLVCEAHRSRPTFAISLMLLDLVQTSTTYGRGGAKTYTWKSMLMHHNDAQDFVIEGRGTDRRSRPLAKHPMAGTGTAKWGKNIVYGANPVVDRILSIASVWFAHFHARRFDRFDFFIIKQGTLGNSGPKQTRFVRDNDGWLQRLCGHAIGLRLATLDLLIGGTTVYYEDVEGTAV